MSIIKNKHYIEELARITLIYLLGNNEEDLYCDESPDIKSLNKRVGIEVISDVFEKETELLNIIDLIWGQPISGIPEKTINQIKKLGGRLDIDENGRVNGARIGSTVNSSEHIMGSAKKKLEKLNKNYSVFPENNLYMFVDSMFLEGSESYIYSLMEYVKGYQGEKNLVYNHLYLDQHYIFYDCNICTMRIQEYRINEKFRKMRNEKANL